MGLIFTNKNSFLYLFLPAKLTENYFLQLELEINLLINTLQLNNSQIVQFRSLMSDNCYIIYFTREFVTGMNT
jgi:hypothetical protein